MFIMQMNCSFFCHSPCLSMNIQEKTQVKKRLIFRCAGLEGGFHFISRSRFFASVNRGDRSAKAIANLTQNRNRACSPILLLIYDVFNQPLETPVTIEKCTTSGGRTKEANGRFFVFVHQRGDDVAIAT